MLLEIFRKNKYTITMLYSLIILIVLSPLLQMLLFSRYYDIEQFFVSDAYNYDIGKYAQFGNDTVTQTFLSRDANLAGFDLQLSGSKEPVKWSLKDVEGNKVRNGIVNNSGESRISTIRFEPIKNSLKTQFYLEIVASDVENGVLLSYSGRTNCSECQLELNGEQINGNLNVTPVYRADTTAHYVEIILKRVFWFY